MSAARLDSRRKKLFALVGASAAVAVLCAGMLAGATPMVRHGRALTSDCAIRLRDPRVHPEALDDCNRAGRWLAIPSLVPWTRAEARATLYELDMTRTRWRMRQVFVEPHPEEQRSELAGALLSLNTRSRVESGLGVAGWQARLLLDAGACRELIDADAQLLAPDSRNAALLCALQVGDIPAALRTARTAPSLNVGEYRSEYAIRRGALLCLAGEETLAEPVLDEVITAPGFDRRVSATVARHICDPASATTSGFNSETVQAIVLGYDATRPSTLEALFNPEHTFREFGRLTPVSAASAILHRALGPEVLQNLAADVRPIVPTVGGPWQLEPWREAPFMLAPIAVYPEELVKAADKLDALAEEKDGMLEARHLQSLRDYADAARLAAAEAWARMGRADRSRALVRTALARTTSPRYVAHGLAVLMFAGEWSTAEALAAKRADAADLELVVMSAWLALHERRWDQAIEKLGPLLDTPQPRRDENQLLLRNRVRDAGVWMLLAAHAGSGKRPDARLRMAAEDLPGWKHESLCGQRLQLGGPAAMFVRGAEATDPSLVEGWLDARTPNCQRVDDQPTLPPGFRASVPIGFASYARMRAEAARYRGDADADAMWQTRASALTAYHSDAKRSVLASITGM